MNDPAWFKSSYSGGEGGNCGEVASDWRKVSHSGAGDCVEVAVCPGAAVHVRGSKDPDGPALTFAPAAWAAFAAFAREERITA